MIEQRTVKCKWCGTATSYTGTKMCDQCWNIDHWIKVDLELSQKILDYYIRKERAKIQCPYCGKKGN